MIGKDLKKLIKSKKMVLNGLNVNLNQAYERYNELDCELLTTKVESFIR